MENENETFLSDWLAGKISDEQLKQLVGESDFLDYQKLKNTLGGYTISNPDMDQNFSVIKQKYTSQKSKTPAKVFLLWRYVGIAAALLLFFGLFQLFYFSNTNQTGFGITQVLILPDNSQVTLNAKSKLSYPNLFKYNRTLDLEGEAYFEVQKGSRFTVKTTLGCVTVLGTKFNVISHNDYFEVICYEGKVRVETKGKIAILTPSESIRFYDHISENWADITETKPSWINGETTFKNVPVQYVLTQFTNQYNVKVDYPKSVENVKFTGAFTNKNKDIALKSICIPLHLKYSNNGTGKIIISE
jgi:ferric-dicitrate binding protein FerR (iron transport regulator)